MRHFVTRIMALAVMAALAPAAAAQTRAAGLEVLLAGQGPFDVARTNAALAQRHVKAALRETDLAAMKAEVVAAVNALDPSLAPRGPAVDGGARAAVAAAVEQLLALQAAHRDDEEGLRATAASVAAQTALMRTDEALGEARDALAAESTARAVPALVRLDNLLDRIMAGQDLDGDGEASWNQGEGGLQQAWSFTRQMAIAEGVQVVERR